jgi:shikimate kinase
MNIILIGLPASGKSSVGRSLASELSWTFCDTDQLIEEEGGLSCRELYLKKGDTYFRKVEKEVIIRLHSAKEMVIATGGGILSDSENSRMLQKIGMVVYLQAEVSTLWNRLVLRGIPAFLPQNNPEEAFRSLAKTRIPLYKAAAHLVVNTEGLDPERVVEELKAYGK